MTNAANGVLVIQPMGYDDARELIRDGDLIAVRGSGHALTMNGLIRTVTRSPYTHTGVALWVEERLLIVETRGVAALVPLSQFADNDFDVVSCPVPGDQAAATAAVREAVFTLLGLTIKYDWGDVARLAAHELLGVRLPAKEDGRMVCSSLSATILMSAGWNPSSLDAIPTPRDVVAAAGRVVLQVRKEYTHG